MTKTEYFKIRDKSYKVIKKYNDAGNLISYRVEEQS